ELGADANVARAGSVLVSARSVDHTLGLLALTRSAPARELPALVRGRDQDDATRVEQAVCGWARRVRAAEGRTAVDPLQRLHAAPTFHRDPDIPGVGPWRSRTGTRRSVEEGGQDDSDGCDQHQAFGRQSAPSR